MWLGGAGFRLEVGQKDSVNAAPEAILVIAERKNILFSNQGARATFGYAPAEVLDRPLDLLWPERLAAERRR